MAGDELTLRVLHKDLQELSGYVYEVAKRVFNKDEGMYRRDEYSDLDMRDHEMDKMPIEGPAGAPRMADDEEDFNDILPVETKMPDGHMPPMEEEEDYEHMDDDMMMAYKAQVAKEIRQAYARGLAKGYADAAQENADEHDAPFGEKDADLEGNEPQPAGAQGGDKEDETFGPGGLAYRAMKKELEELRAIVASLDEGQVIAKSGAPAIGRISKGQPAEAPNMVTREMQEQAKSLSYKDLNRIREEMGEIPKFGIHTR